MKIEHVTVESLMAESKGAFNKRVAQYAKDHGMKLGEAQRYLMAFALGRKSSLAVDRAKRSKSARAGKPKAKAKAKAKKASAKSKTTKRSKKPAKAKAKAKAAPKVKTVPKAKVSRPRVRKPKAAPNGTASADFASSLGDQIAAPLES